MLNIVGGEESKAETTSRRKRTQRTTTSSGGGVFSRLTAPTKATIGKSKRKEDKDTRDEWRKTMNSQLAHEESLMNMGGFVLKEQRYKKMADQRSPMSAKQKKRDRVATAKTRETGRTHFETDRKMQTTTRQTFNQTTHSYSGMCLALQVFNTFKS